MPVADDSRWARRALWLLFALLWFAMLGYRDLIPPDEGRYAEIAREMAASGDWVTPHLNGLKYFEKPALHYWVSAALFRLFGLHDGIARLWPGLCGFLLVPLLQYTARQHGGRSAGDYTALVAAGGLWLVADGHYLTLDMGLVLFMTAALCTFLLAFHPQTPPERRRVWLLCVWAAMACAVLTKGLIGLLLPGLVLVLYVMVTGQWSLLLRLQWAAGLTVFFALVLPWFVAVSLQNPEFPHFFFIHEHWERYTTTEHQRVGSWYYFVPVLLGGFLPWTLMLPSALRHALAGSRATFCPQHFLLLWAAVIFAFFSVSGSKLPSYILPVFPALALVTGRYLDVARPGRLAALAAATAVFWLAAGLGVMLAGQHRPELLDRLFCQRAGAFGVVYAVFCAVGAGYFYRGSKRAGAVALALATLVAGQGILLSHQVYSPQRSAKRWVEVLDGKVDAATPFYTVAGYNQTLPYYLRRTLTLVNWVDEFELGIAQSPASAIADEAAFIAVWQRQPRAAATMDDATYAQLQSRLGAHEVLMDAYNTVILRKVPPAIPAPGPELR